MRAFLPLTLIIAFRPEVAVQLLPVISRLYVLNCAVVIDRHIDSLATVTTAPAGTSVDSVVWPGP